MCMEHAQFARVMSHAAPPPAPRDNGPDPAPAASACPGGTYASEPRVGTRPPYVDHADAGWRVGGINEPPLARGEFHDRVSRTVQYRRVGVRGSRLTLRSRSRPIGSRDRVVVARPV